MAQEAGAVFTSIDGGGVDLGNPRIIDAATPELHGELSASLARGAARH
jgi:fructose-1,6-bisphosphatase/inositol monophosphatase family enzyme